MEDKKQNKKSFFGKGIFPAKWAWTLLIPCVRGLIYNMSPKQVLDRLHVEKNHHILEVGCGPGYYSPTITKAIPEGKLILSDIQPKMLEMAKKRINKYGLKNVKYHLCDGDSFPFKNNSLDRIFLITVIAEVENKDKYVQEFFRMLHPEGIVSIEEQWGDNEMSKDELIELFKMHGFILDEIYEYRLSFTLNFKKPNE